MNPNAVQLAEAIKRSNNLVFFGGAGISTASGLPDFRSSEGLFSKRLFKHCTPEELLSHTYFYQYPEDFFDFYKTNLICTGIKPNACHYALAKLEKLNRLKVIVTQNIDGLHQAAGSKQVLELHGSIHRNYCTVCHTKYDAGYMLHSDGVPTCQKCGGMIKPDVVLYEEPLDNVVLSAAVRAIASADTLIVGGTSLSVYPAAGLLDYFKGKCLVLINKTFTPADGQANLVIHEEIAGLMKEAVDLVELAK